MKTRHYITGLLLAAFSLTGASAQQGAVNHGAAMQLHEGGQLGFHIDFNNEGVFDKNKGLVGFYSDGGRRTLGGANPVEVHDAEFATTEGLLLENVLIVNNNGNLIEGDVLTSTQPGVRAYLQFNDQTFYTGESDHSKVQGYAVVTNKQEFTFPVGDAERLRPLTISSTVVDPQAACAYFPEDPARLSNLVGAYNFSAEGQEVPQVSSREFWVLDGEQPSRVTLSWDRYSNTRALSADLKALRVVGLSKASKTWVDLGNTRMTGDQDTGTVTSDFFVPGQYEAITLGGPGGMGALLARNGNGNYLLSPNGDGRNDVLALEGLEDARANTLEVYSNQGQLVYRKDNYQNDFDGTGSPGLGAASGGKLPEGVYYYLLRFHDTGKLHQGYFYLSRD